MRLSKQNKIVVGIIALVLALTVGYALFSESLNINGTAKASGDFGLEFVSVDAIRKEGYTDASSNGSASEEEIKQKIATIVDVNGKKNRGLSVTVDKLNYPGAYVEIDATIKNVGTIDAILKGIEVTSEDGVVNDTTISNDDIEITYSGVAKDYVMRSDENDESNTRQITIKVRWKESSANKNPAALTFNIGLNFEQATGNLAGGTTGGDEFKFPVVEGQLGDNVFFKYDNGAIDITGSGDMWDGKIVNGGYCDGLNDTGNCSLGNEITMKLLEKLNIKNEKIKPFLGVVLSMFTTTPVDQMNEVIGASKEELEQSLITTEENGGLGLNEEEKEEFMKIFNSIPTPKSLKIQNGITSIRQNFFYNVVFETLTIPNTITRINGDYGGRSIFSQSTINTINLEEGIEKIPTAMLSGVRVNNLILPEGVKIIASHSMGSIKGLTKLTIPSTVTSIETSAIPLSNDLITVVNKTGRAFDWNGILTGTQGEEFIYGTVEYNGTITITDK